MYISLESKYGSPIRGTFEMQTVAVLSTEEELKCPLSSLNTYINKMVRNGSIGPSFMKNKIEHSFGPITNEFT